VEQDHYAVLGLKPGAPQAEIRSAYRALMRRYHPDADPTTEAAEQAREINQAYAVLGDPEKRARYDASRVSKQPLKFEPGLGVSSKRKTSPAAPALAVAISLVAAGMVAFAIIPSTHPLPLGSPNPQRQVRPIATVKSVDSSETRSVLRHEMPRPVALNSVAPDEDLAEPEPVELAVVEPAASINTAVAPRPVLAPASTKAASPEIKAPASASCPDIVRTPDRLICGDRNLASLDRQLSLLYRQSWDEADEPKRAALLGSRQRFIDRREACETSNCLTTAYVGRLKEISDIMAGRVQP
jgi:curved DNA-binding protein CbpA